MTQTRRIIAERSIYSSAIIDAIGYVTATLGIPSGSYARVMLC